MSDTGTPAASAAIYYLHADIAGAVFGCGFSPDGTLPEGCVVCSYAQYQSPSLYRVVNGAIAPQDPAVVAAQIAAAADAANTAQRTNLINAASHQISILSDATDPTIVATVAPTDVASLTAWRKYRVALSQVDPTQSTITWPVAPGATS